MYANFSGSYIWGMQRDSINQVEFYKSQFRFRFDWESKRFSSFVITQLFSADVFPSEIHLAKYRTIAALIGMI